MSKRGGAPSGQLLISLSVSLPELRRDAGLAPLLKASGVLRVLMASGEPETRWVSQSACSSTLWPGVSPSDSCLATCIQTQPNS